MFYLFALKIKTITVLYIGHLATPSYGPLHTPSPLKGAGEGLGTSRFTGPSLRPFRPPAVRTPAGLPQSGGSLPLLGSLQPFGALKGGWGSAVGVSAGYPKGHSQPLP